MKKKILALLLAMAMTMGMSTVAFAAEQKTDNVLTVKGIENAKDNHNYVAYQIFTGKYEELDGEKHLVDIKWGSAFGGESTGAKTIGGTEYVSGAAFAKAISDGKMAFDSAEAQKLASDIMKASPENAISLTWDNSSKTYKATGLKDGYYLVCDTEITDGQDPADGIQDTATRYVLTMIGDDNDTITVKATTVSIDKMVEETNDSNSGDADNGWHKDSASWDVGDKVPFMYEVTIPSDIDNYEEAYIFKFVDTMTKGLTFNNDVKVTIGDAAYTSATTTLNADFVDEEGKDQDNMDATFTVTTADLRNKGYAGKKMVVTYSATLNADAVVKDGEVNHVHLVFNNDPHGDGKGKTPDVTVVVFTFELDVNKVDQDNQPLAGAKFTLYKKVANDATADSLKLDTTSKNALVWLDSEYKVTTSDADGAQQYLSYGEVEAVAKNGKYTGEFKGIDDGNYVLVETVTPDGYNTSAPKTFTISADHSKNPIEVKMDGKEMTDNIATVDVINQGGAILPATGGVGTTLFYVIGGILIVGGGAMLFVKRKMGREEI